MPKLLSITRMRSTLTLVLACSLTVFAFSPGSYSQTTDEDSLKRTDLVRSAYLFKIASFVYWPEKSLSNEGAPLICIVGRDVFRAARWLMNNQMANLDSEHAGIAEADADSLQELSCDIVFVSAAEMTPTLQRSLGSVENHLVTISDKKGFARGIGMIELTERSNRIRMLINSRNLKGRTVKLSSQLLEVADLL